MLAAPLRFVAPLCSKPREISYKPHIRSENARKIRTDLYITVEQFSAEYQHTVFHLQENLMAPSSYGD